MMWKKGKSIYELRIKNYKMEDWYKKIGKNKRVGKFEKWFFEKHTTIAEKLKYAGAIIGGVLLVINAIYIHQQTKEQNRSNNLVLKQIKEQNRSNNLVTKGQLDTRFKDAAILLASGNTSAELSAIHALNQIAIEASQTKDQQDYVKVIKDILIAFIKENSVIEYKKDKKGEILLDNFSPIIEKAYNAKGKIVLQTIIDKLFKDTSCKIYAEYSTDLSKTVLKEINFEKAQLQNANFRETQLENVKFSGAQLQNTNFCRAQIQVADFDNSQLQVADFSCAHLKLVSFSYAQLYRTNFNMIQSCRTYFLRAQLQETYFVEAQLEYASFWGAQLQKPYFTKAQLQNVDFQDAHNIESAWFYNTSWNEKANFKGTAFENKTIEELTKIMIGSFPALE